MNQEKVLIVEDEENERTGMAELISSWGYAAETARDGQEGHEKVNGWSPAIVITDLKMPRMGGLELLEKIAADTRTIAVMWLRHKAQSTARSRRCAWAPTITSPNRSIQTACARFCRMPRLCSGPVWNWKSRAANCAMRDRWDRWWGHRRKCRKFSAWSNWFLLARLRF